MRSRWLAVALLAACTDGAMAIECRLTSDCVSPLICESQRCVPQCRTDVDCGADETCVADKCERRHPQVRICLLSRDCRSGETCRAGICTVAALITTPTNPPPDAGVMMSLPDSGAPGADASIPAGLPYGAVCTAASQCASMLCLGAGSDGRCTRACMDDRDCTYPDACVDVAGAAGQCATAPSVGATGALCPNGPSDCASGLCLAPPGVAAVCTHQCSPLPSCPAGLTCQPIPDGAGGAVAVCFPGNGGGFGEPCTAASQCATRLCVGDPSSGSGLCTAPCHQIPCPMGWVCTNLPDGTGGTAPVCAPEGAAGGGFGSACTGASSCANGLCLNDARSGSAFCTIPCRGHNDCAAVPGLFCVSLQGGAQVCGPP